MSDPEKKERDEKEIAKRRDEVLRRMLKTPPKPHKDIGGKKRKKPTENGREDK